MRTPATSGAHALPRAIGVLPRATLRAARGGGRLAGHAARAVPRRLRRPLAALLLLGALLASGYLLWLRDSQLVAVERVTIVGLARSADATEVREALDRTARGMTTLHVREPALTRAAANASPSVMAVEARPDFPHGLTIEVRQHRPVAIVGPPGQPGLPVATDGTVLPRMPLRGPLPRLEGPAPPGGRVASAATRRAVAIAGAAPAPLLGRVRDVVVRPGKGVVVLVGEGPELIFGDATRARAKWAAAVRVLASPEAEGAAYVDLRLPERPAAGGFPPGADTVAPGEAEAGEGGPHAGHGAPQAPGTDPGTGASPTPQQPPAAPEQATSPTPQIQSQP